jgi:hypothetical protein
MRRFCLMVLLVLAASASLASARDWKYARVMEASETDVSGHLHGDKNILHYAIETEDAVYFADYTYNPNGRSNNHAPDIGANMETKVAIEGKHVYVLDANGKEVKLHLVKKPVVK